VRHPFWFWLALALVLAAFGLGGWLVVAALLRLT
jgi:hypothetical protein